MLIDYVLGLFGDKVFEARGNYREYVRKRIYLGRRPELVGAGLLRSSGGWGVLKAMSKARIHLKGDERILGDCDFVEEVLYEFKLSRIRYACIHVRPHKPIGLWSNAHGHKGL